MKTEVITPRYTFAFTQEHLDVADELCAQADRDFARRVSDALEREVARLIFGSLPDRLPFLVTHNDQLFVCHPQPSRFGVVRTDIS